MHLSLDGTFENFSLDLLRRNEQNNSAKLVGAHVPIKISRLGVRFFFIIKTKGCRRFEIERSEYTVAVLEKSENTQDVSRMWC